MKNTNNIATNNDKTGIKNENIVTKNENIATNNDKTATYNEYTASNDNYETNAPYKSSKKIDLSLNIPTTNEYYFGMNNNDLIKLKSMSISDNIYQSDYHPDLNTNNNLVLKDNEISPEILNNESKLKCCLVEKKYISDGSHTYGGSFIYKFNKLENEACEMNNFMLDSNKQLFFDKTNETANNIPNNSLMEWSNNWSNNNCDIKNNILGSCRSDGKICIEFIDKNVCDTYKMRWSSKTCNEDLNSNYDYNTPVDDKILENIVDIKSSNDFNFSSISNSIINTTTSSNISSNVSSNISTLSK